MDSKFQSSFIPKNNVVSGVALERRGTGLFGFMAILVFIISIVASGGLFAYKKVSQNAVESLKTQLTTAEQSIDQKELNAVLDLNKRIIAIKEILTNHVAVSEYFKILEQSTLSDTSFNSLKYVGMTADKNIEIELGGKASSYASLAQEERVLAKNTSIISYNFDGMSLDKEDGKVMFKLKLGLKESAIKESNLLTSGSVSSNPTVFIATSTTVMKTSTSTSATTSASSVQATTTKSTSKTATTTKKN